MKRIQFILIFSFMAGLGIPASPVSAQGYSVSYGDIDFVVRQGGDLAGSFRVSSNSEDVIYLRIYSGDWARKTESGTDYTFEVESGFEERSFIEWMTYSPDTMELAAGETKEVYFEVNFPEEIQFDGSHWGVVFVEEVLSIGEGVPKPADNGLQVGITTKWRYAVKIYATFEGTEIREGSFTDLALERVDDGFDVSAMFKNTGNIYMKPEMWVEIRNSGGEVIYRQDHIRQTMLPESSREYIFEVRDLELDPGTYLLMVVADYYGPALVAIQGTMEIKQEEDFAAD